MLFAELTRLAPARERAWILDQLVGYLGTWFATRAFRKLRGEDCLPALRAWLTPPWGGPERKLEVRWPLPARIGRRP